MLRLELFGAMKVHVQDPSGPPCVLPLTGRPAGLLAYLSIAHGQFFSRSELTLALWSEQHEAASSGCFNTVLWRLRRALPAHTKDSMVICDRRGAVGLSPALDITLDLHEFAAYVEPALGKPLALCRDEDLSALKRGVALYKGEVLAGFTEEWALRAREKHRRLHLNALGRLMQLCSLAQDWHASIGYAQAILDQDPLREDIHRELMGLYLHSGQRPLALRQYETCRSALKRELAIPPMQETHILYQAIAHAALHPAQASPPASLRWQPSASHPAPRSHLEPVQDHLAQAEAELQMSLPGFG
jgi:DNA-binding SARP family transcriptional activator